jgi:rubrerythrin
MEREAIFRIFKEAIEDEQRAHKFYMKAAASTPDPALKKTFEELARTELRHSEILEEKYQELKGRKP